MEIFAKAAGTDIKGLFRMMEQGKVGSDIVLKAGVLMGDWADKQGTLSAALEMSAAKQEQFNNKLREMSLLILKSGLDQAIAALFSVLTPLVEIVGTGLAFIFKMLKGIYATFKIFTDFAKENQLLTAIALVEIAVGALMLAFGRLALVNTIVFFQMIANIIRVNALLWITRLRVLGIIGLFTYLLTQLDDFFVHGKEDNIFMTWYYTVQLVMSELDLMFAKIKYKMFELRNSPKDFVKGLVPEFSGKSLSDLTFKDVMTMGAFDWMGVIASDVGQAINNGLLPSTMTPSQAVQQSTPATVTQSITVNIDAKSMPSNVQSQLVNGNTDLFAELIGNKVNAQTRVTPYR